MNKKTVYERIIPGILLAIFLLGSLIPLSIFSAQYYVSRVFSFVFIAIITAILVYEFFKSQRIKWYWVVTLSLIGLSLAFIPVQEITLRWLNPATAQALFKPELLVEYTRIIALDPFTIIVCLVLSVCLLLIDSFTRVYSHFSQVIIRALIAFVTLYLLAIFSKVFHLFIVISGQWKYWFSISLIAAVTDTFSFIFGVSFGRKFIKKPFTPTISPNKSWEGFIGGVISGVIATFILVYSLDLFENNYLKIIFAILAPLFAVVGDLYFSFIKRSNGIKDYSKILRGHGGILDRLDSICFITVLSFVLILFTNVKLA
ncbi:MULTISPECIES: phosphatidate cytidylyltransferase [unclassified Mycoplasma]|uniref:phosphatidate cytidylyltransferase n=1 Tax=unclassified Mycoplasma TaxID=2683645 RepID=UPI00216AD5D7|nr:MULTISPECIES: phosphatidate cytidylyltransferase [unclassified Mycoplasma]MCS4536701.1 phosphatidate cytidylyltransferase [Mycoplasma sp. CSL7475-4]MCT4469812.1 phosphatidate cytidylyltransferase [Mycoplasma sp. HS2188]